MLLIDGVKYKEYIPKSEDELEYMVNEHSQEIFGENSLYFDRKLRLKSLSGIGSIPDGYVIVLDTKPQWHIIEVELSSHQLYNHIVPQVGRFISGINNPNTRKIIIDELYHAIIRDRYFNDKVDKYVQTGEIYKFISDLISASPAITIIIEKDTAELGEALSSLGYSKKNIVEFKTFIREGVGLAVHAHLFEPLFSQVTIGITELVHDKKKEYEQKINEQVKAKKVAFEELINAGLLHDNQILIFFHTRPFSNEQAKVISSSNELIYLKDGQKYSKSELAKQLLIKHGFKHDEHGVAGPRYWITEDGKSLRDLEEQIRIKRGDRKSGSAREGR